MTIRIRLLTLLLLVACFCMARHDPRSLRLSGVCLEGPVDTLVAELKAAEWSPWGQSDDGEDYFFRGKYYGIRAKLLLSAASDSRLASSVYVTVGPYSTEAMLQKNLSYFRYQLEKEYGSFTQRDGAWVFLDDCGSIKCSVVDNGNGSRDIRVLYYPTEAYYKDAAVMGLRGPVQEVVTENAIAEEQFMHFLVNGQLDLSDLSDRQYDRYGYLTSGRMTEKEGYSQVTYDYDDDYRLVRRTLTNPVAGITYTNEYTYNDEGDILTQRQKVFDSQKECIMTINMRNNYLTRDDQGNWTSNSLSLSYWEKGSQSQQTIVLQKRTITYWD